MTTATPTHTPGPWIAAHNFEWEIRSCGPIRADIASMKFSPDGREAADARLIAAAPELLEACREAVKLLHDPQSYGEDCQPCYGMLRGAIAKAEGR